MFNMSHIIWQSAACVTYHHHISDPCIVAIAGAEVIAKLEALGERKPPPSHTI